MERLAIDGGRPLSEKLIPIARPVLGDEEARAVSAVVLSGSLREGSNAHKFEEMFASYVGVKQAIAVNSGTSALLTTYMASFEKGSELIMPSFTFIATASMAVAAGLKPIFVDIRLDTYELDLDDAVSRMTDRTRGIVVVNLYGLASDLTAVMKLAEELKLSVIVDASQSLGSTVDGRESGAYGDVACYSFYPSKNITTGEGGMMATNRRDIAERARLIKNHGQRRGGYLHEILGFNLRMGEMEAAIGLIQLQRLGRFIEARRKNAERIKRVLADIPGLDLPVEPPGRRHTYNLFTVRIDPELYRVDRDRIVTALRAEGVDARVYYPIPLHEQPVFRKLTVGGLERAEMASRTVISLPCHPALSEEEVDVVARAVEKVLATYLKR